MKNSFTGREFQFWQYRVSHGELLIRSPKTMEHSRNMDLMFFGVEYVELPRHLPDLEVDESNDEDMMRVRKCLGQSVERQNVIILKSQGHRYLVVAAAVQFAESDMDIFDSPFL